MAMDHKRRPAPRQHSAVSHDGSAKPGRGRAIRTDLDFTGQKGLHHLRSEPGRRARESRVAIKAERNAARLHAGRGAARAIDLDLTLELSAASSDAPRHLHLEAIGVEEADGLIEDELGRPEHEAGPVLGNKAAMAEGVLAEPASRCIEAKAADGGRLETERRE